MNTIKIFTIWIDKIKNRLDPLFYSEDIFNFLKVGNFDVVSLGEVATFMKAGFAAGKQNHAEENNGIIQIRPTNIDDLGSLKFDKNIVLPKELIDKRADDLVQKGEILFNNTNSQELVGKTAYFNLEGDYFCSNHVTRIRVNQKKISPKFLWWLLNNYQARGIFFRICVNWNNQSGVNIDLLKSLKISLPLLDKQKNILAILEEAYSEKGRKKEEVKTILASIDNFVLCELGIDMPRVGAEQVFQIWSDEIQTRLDPSYFRPIFKMLDKIFSTTKYDVKTLKNLSSKIMSGSTPLSGGNAYTDQNSGVPFVRSGDINPDNEIDFNSLLYVKPEIHNKKLKSSQLKRGDLLVALIGATIGQVSIYSSDKEANISQNLASVRLKEEVLSDYAKEFLLSKIGQMQLERVKRYAARANINLDEVGSLQIIYPSKDKQNEMVAKIRKIRAKATALRQETESIVAGAQKQIEQMILA